jgi:uncharacterized protein (TIGR02217 family)
LSNSVLPTLAVLTFPVSRTPRWSTKIQTATSGKETRLGLWSYPIWEYSVAYSILRSDVNVELQTLAGFFNARQGSFDSWLFNDPDDNAVSAQSFGAGNGSTTQFQLARTFGGYVEPVQALNGTPSIYVSGALQTAGTNYSISATGLVTFVTAPAASAPLTWTGSFYWRCRFLTDAITLDKFLASFWELKALKFQSIK